MQEPLIITVALRCMFKPLALPVFDMDWQGLANNPKRRHEQIMSRTWRRHILANAIVEITDKKNISHNLIEKNSLQQNRLEKIELYQLSSSLRFANDSYGKPYLADYPNLQFNQSHCSEQFVLVFNRQGIALGVDVELRNRVINLSGLAKRILTVREQGIFEQASDPKYYFLRQWTIKEAILKACGLGIRINLNTLEAIDVALLHSDLKSTQSDLASRANVQIAGIVEHKDIGTWAYQCFETIECVYSVAWKYQPDQAVIFNGLD